MNETEILDKMRDGYTLHYAAVTGGQCLLKGRDVIYLPVAPFLSLHEKGLINQARQQRQGHEVFHGLVYVYELTEGKTMNKQPDDGTRGHSGGKWSYYGDVFVGISTDCQHPTTPEEIAENYPAHVHECDDLLYPMDESKFDKLAMDTEITWNEYRANLRLMALAQTAPHHCGNPACAGQQNAAKLALFDKMVAAFERIEAWDFDIMGDCVADARLVARVILSEVKR